MTRRRFASRSAVSRSRGFSLIELLVVVLLLGLICGAIFKLITVVQERNRTEQVKVDYLQEARDFVDQFFRDINQVGYPNGRMIDPASPTWVPPLPLPPTPLVNDNRVAAGLVKIDTQEIWFEGDMYGSGGVQSIVYKVNGTTACPLCLERSQTNKVSASPVTGQTQNWGTEVNDVQNPVIFTYFDTNGAQVFGPLDISTAAGAQKIATIKTVQINLRITNPAVIDLKTKQPIEMTFQGEVSINNCSLAAPSQPMSCL